MSDGSFSSAVRVAERPSRNTERDQTECADRSSDTSKITPEHTLGMISLFQNMLGMISFIPVESRYKEIETDKRTQCVSHHVKRLLAYFEVNEP